MDACRSKYDVIVAGGGISGFSAAVTAARLGAKTLLIESSGDIGGCAALAGVANFCTDGSPLDANGPLWHEILTRLRACHAIGAENGFPSTAVASIHTENHPFAQALLSPVLLTMLRENSVDILLHMSVTGVVTDNGHLLRAVIHNESLSFEVAGSVFIDATGDGTLALHAGGESLPDHDGEFEPLPPAFRIYLRKTPHPTPLPPSEPSPYPYGVQELPDGTVVLKLNLKQKTTLSAAERNETEVEVRSNVLKIVRDFQDKHGECYQLCGTAQNLAVRESRRIRGDYVLTTDDIRHGRVFDDAVVSGRFIIDTVHRHEQIPEFTIPYRALLVKGTDNLLVCGRCLSAERGAMSAARIMSTCCKMGQACGAAAALACSSSTPLRALSPKTIAKDILPKEI